jgi:hypothetical protein
MRKGELANHSNTNIVRFAAVATYIFLKNSRLLAENLLF